MVERPLVFTLADLKRFPSVSRICFLECPGNFRKPVNGTVTPQEICGLTSQSEWTGVMLSTLFRKVGVALKATWFLAEGRGRCRNDAQHPPKQRMGSCCSSGVRPLLAPRQCGTKAVYTALSTSCQRQDHTVRVKRK